MPVTYSFTLRRHSRLLHHFTCHNSKLSQRAPWTRTHLQLHLLLPESLMASRHILSRDCSGLATFEGFCRGQFMSVGSWEFWAKCRTVWDMVDLGLYILSSFGILQGITFEPKNLGIQILYWKARRLSKPCTWVSCTG